MNIHTFSSCKRLAGTHGGQLVLTRCAQTLVTFALKVHVTSAMGVLCCDQVSGVRVRSRMSVLYATCCAVASAVALVLRGLYASVDS